MWWKCAQYFSELLFCGGSVRSNMFLPLVARCLDTIDVCIWRMFVFMSVVVSVGGILEYLLCSGREDIFVASEC